MRISGSPWRLWLVLALLTGNMAQAADAPPGPAPIAPNTTPAPGASLAADAPSTPSASLAAPMSAAKVIDVLDQTVDWYRTLGIQQQAATEPSDLLILYDNRQTAARVMALAVEIARADADLLARLPAAPATTGPAAGDALTSSQGLLQLQQKLDTQATSVTSELAAERRPQRDRPRRTKEQVQAKINELQGELDLINTKKSIVATMSGFSADAGDTGTAALKAQIDAMAVSVPSAAPGAPGATSAPGVPAATPAAPTPSIAARVVGRFGLWDLAADVYRLTEKAGTVTAVDRRTAALQDTLAQVRAPLVEQLKALSARGDALATLADQANADTLNGVHEQLDGLSGDFKQASALLIPLSREGVLLTQYRRNLGNWRDSVRTQYHAAIGTLLTRAVVLAIVLSLIFGAAELWRRMVFKYIQEPRRRYQLLLLRRIALWSLVVLVVGFAFASELGSIVTFAGLITAGIAVAMQSVLVSIVGYFFLIGKYGIRVGDRVQIGAVSGEVIDLGLVRMYLMELGANGTMGPTGRVVAFANSVIFQVASGLFKQIPGVDFSWREVVLTLPVGADTAALKQRLTAAVTAALTDYLPEILRQTREIERTTSSVSAGNANPQVQLNFSRPAVEAHVRYPVQLEHAAEIEERVTEALARVLYKTPPGAAPGGADGGDAGGK